MARHTIQEAIRLTGKSRKTLYRYMDAGRLSYGIGPEGRRYFDTSELIRVFGELKGCDTPDTPETIQADTLNALRREIAALRQVVERQNDQIRALTHRLEHLPQEPISKKPPQPVKSFKDLLARFGD